MYIYTCNVLIIVKYYNKIASETRLVHKDNHKGNFLLYLKFSALGL